MGVDPVPVACQMVMAWQTIITRNRRPIDPGVISATMIHTGEAINVVPDSAEIRGTVRTFSIEVLDLIERRMREVAEHTAAAFGATCEFEFKRNYPPTVNHAAETEFVRRVLGTVVGPENVQAFELHHGRGRLQLLPAGQAGLLLRHRQRRRRPPRRWPRPGAVHAAQPQL